MILMEPGQVALASNKLPTGPIDCDAVQTMKSFQELFLRATFAANVADQPGGSSGVSPKWR